MTSMATADIRRSGFTMIELVASLAILSVLALASVPLFKIEAQRTRERDLRAALREIRAALDTYKRLSDDGVVSKSADASGFPPDLEVLAQGIVNRAKPNGGKIHLLRRIPRDPFDTDERKPAAATWGVRSYASPADAPQLGIDVFDVYSRSEAVGLNGVPYRLW